MTFFYESEKYRNLENKAFLKCGEYVKYTLINKMCL